MHIDKINVKLLNLSYKEAGIQSAGAQSTAKTSLEGIGILYNKVATHSH